MVFLLLMPMNTMSLTTLVGESGKDAKSRSGICKKFSNNGVMERRLNSDNLKRSVNFSLLSMSICILYKFVSL